MTKPITPSNLGNQVSKPVVALPGDMKVQAGYTGPPPTNNPTSEAKPSAPPPKTK